MIIGDSGTTVSLILGITGLIGAIVSGYQAFKTYKLKARTDDAESKIAQSGVELSGVKVSQDALTNALHQYEGDNDRLRKEVDRQGSRIVDLQKENEDLRTEMRARDHKCQESMDVLRAEIRKLKGEQ